MRNGRSEVAALLCLQIYSEKKRLLQKRGATLWSLVASKVPELVKIQQEAKTARSQHLKNA